MHNSKSRIVATLAEIASAQILRAVVFCRGLWFAIRWFRRNREYRNGIGEVVDGMPLPSARLISNVTGIPDIAWYLVSGKLSAEDVIGSLRKNGIHLCSLKTILDFGCGCARVTRHMFRLESSAIYGVDVDGDAIKWCQQQFSSDHFKISSYVPHLDFSNSSFDLVYAISVFTHLTTELVVGWIEELRRVISPGGYLIFTTIGEKFLGRLSNSERVRFNQGSPVVKTERYSSSNLCRAYHPYDFISKELKHGFTIVDFSAGAAKGTPGQDLYLFRKK
jgi:2-polyprenyl-3-methyl-5-hydroxy-6-metoxy-1,4-benzoquinol methylase